ncbi:Rho/RAC guanine nucleotide exchange factor [Entamoeba marina]
MSTLKHTNANTVCVDSLDPFFTPDSKTLSSTPSMSPVLPEKPPTPPPRTYRSNNSVGRLKSDGNGNAIDLSKTYSSADYITSPRVKIVRKRKMTEQFSYSIYSEKDNSQPITTPRGTSSKPNYGNPFVTKSSNETSSPNPINEGTSSLRQQLPALPPPRKGSLNKKELSLAIPSKNDSPNTKGPQITQSLESTPRQKFQRIKPNGQQLFITPPKHNYLSRSDSSPNSNGEGRETQNPQTNSKTISPLFSTTKKCNTYNGTSEDLSLKSDNAFQFRGSPSEECTPDGRSSASSSISYGDSTKTYRQRILDEFINTELSYVSGLKTCIKFYKEPLYKKAKQSVIDLLNIVFKGFEDVNRMNQKLLEDLNSLRNNEGGKSLDTHLGEALCNFVPFLSVYKLYVGNTELQQEVLVKLETNKGFVKTCEEMQSKINIGHALNLRAYLITPVQRLPRYKLLLEDLIRNTEEDHCDYERLKTALEKVKSINIIVNKSVDEQSRQTKLVEISRKIKGYDQLIQPTRYYIYDGELTKITKKGKSTRHLFLFNDLIIYTKKAPEMTVKFVTQIENVMATDDTDISFNILSPSKSFTMLCKNEEDKREWISQIVDAIIAQQQLLPLSKQKKTVNYAPLLLRQSTHKCQLCDKTFGFMNKKQFCVNCGLCICNSCYKGRFVVNGENKRGCDRCVQQALSNNSVKLDEDSIKQKKIHMKTEKGGDGVVMLSNVDLGMIRTMALTKQRLHSRTLSQDNQINISHLQTKKRRNSLKGGSGGIDEK